MSISAQVTPRTTLKPTQGFGWKTCFEAAFSPFKIGITLIPIAAILVESVDLSIAPPRP
jgi:hypothetical protein